MKTIFPDILEAARLKRPARIGTNSGDHYGAFQLRGPSGADLVIIASSDGGWEHVSVSIRRRNPNWDEMCFVKKLFWDDDEIVVQFHPAKSQYINNHPHCLHLWRSTEVKFPTPPPIMVGVKDLANMSEEEKKAVSLWRNLP